MLLRSWLDWFREYLFGDDVFISYSRRDGAAYAAALANALSGPGVELSCFLDQWGASPAEVLSMPVRAALDRSRIFVLVGTPGAAESPMVREEVGRFSHHRVWHGHRPVIPLNVSGGLDRVAWSELTGLHRVLEARDSIDRGRPSAAVVELIRDSVTFTSRNQRVRRLTAVALVLLAAAVAAGGYAVNRAAVAREQERIARVNADRATAEADNAQRSAADARENAEKARLAERESEASASNARAAEALAEANRRRATEQARLADARQVAAAAMLMVQQGNRLADGVRSALDLVGGASGVPVVEAYQALRAGLGVLPAIARPPLTLGGPSRLLSLSGDGTVLAAADAAEARVWDTETRRLVASWPGFHQGLAVSDDGSMLALAKGGAVDVLRLVARTLGASPSVAPGQAARFTLRLAEHLTFSADGRYLAAIGYGGGSARLWTLGTPQRERAVDGGRALAFSPDGEFLFVAGRDALHAVRTADESAPPRSFAVAIPPAALLAFSRNGSRLAVADDATVAVWHWQPAGEWRLAASVTHQSRPTALGVSNDGRRVSVGSEDGTVQLIDMMERRQVLRPTHARAVTSTRFGRERDLLVTADEGGVIQMWNATPDTFTRRLSQSTQALAIGFDSRDPSLWTIDRDGQMRQWTDPASRPVRVEAGPLMSDGEIPFEVTAAAFDASGRYAAVAVSDQSVFSRDLTSGQTRDDSVNWGVTAVAVGAGGVIAIGGDRLALWRPGTAGPLPLALEDVGALAFSPDGRLLAAATGDGRVRILDPRTGAVTRTWPTTARAVAFSGDGRWLGALSGDHVSVWAVHATTPSEVRLGRSPRATASLALDAGGRYVAYAAESRTASVWDLARQVEVARLTHDAEVASLAFDRTGDRLAVVSRDGAVTLSRWRPAELVAEARRRLLPPAGPSEPPPGSPTALGTRRR